MGLKIAQLINQRIFLDLMCQPVTSTYNLQPATSLHTVVEPTVRAAVKT